MSQSIHFVTEAGGEPTAGGRYYSKADMPSLEFLPGLEFRPVMGEQSLANIVSFAPHTEAPMHTHVEEQIVIVLEGELEFNLDGEIKLMGPGDIAVIPSRVPHGARTLDTSCVEVDVFSPPRANLVEHAQKPEPRTAG
jgi:quercetin dioxygenase-like cupin family protein